MKKLLLSQKRLTRLFYSLCMLLLYVNVGWGQQQQVIGSFPTMDGGFEGQTGGYTLTAANSTTLWSISTTSSTVKTIVADAATARSGNKYVSFTNTGTGSTRLQSPTATTLASSTQYTVQYYFKSSVSPYAYLTGAIYFSTTGTNLTLTKTPSTFEADKWIKGTATFTSTATTGTPRFGAPRINGVTNTTDIINVDDFVVYAGSVDETAPTSPTALTVSGLGVSWTAPAGGVDGGGYVVVRYASNPNLDNDPNPNGIYASGNTITNGTGSLTGTVVFVGTATSFTDAVAGSVSGSDYYKVYAVDKAFNYSEEITAKMDANAPIITSTPATLTGFNYILGSGPTAGQSFTVSGNNLTNDLVVTPSTNYEISTDGTSYDSSTRTFVPSSGTVTSQTIYTRLKEGLFNGTYNESIQVTSTGATSAAVACTGSVSGTYYYVGTGTLSTLTNWGTNIDGTGTNPSSLTSANATFVIKNTTAVSTDAAWTLGSGSKIIVGDASSPAVTLTIVSGSGITGTVDITAASSGSNSVVCQNATIPTFGTLDSTSEVHFQFTSSNALALTATFGKLFFDGTTPNNSISVGSSGTNYIKATIQTSLTIASGAIVNFSNGSNSYFYFNTGATATINGTLKTSKPAGIVGFSQAVIQTATDLSPALQFFDAENPGVNLVLTGSTIEFSRGGSLTPQIIAPRSDYNNVVFSDFTSAAAKTLAANMTVSGTLTMNHTFGTTLAGAGSITMGNGASIIKTSGTFGTIPFTFGSTVNVTYNGTIAQTPGLEMPTNGSVLNNLTISNAGGVLLAEDTTVNNNLTITAGNLTVPTGKNLTVKASLANSGTLTVENNANLIQTSVSNTNTGSGNAIIKRNSNPLYRLDYTMWSSPVASQNLLTFSPATTTTRFYSFDSANNVYSSIADPSLTPFTVGNGYLIRMPNTDPTANYDVGTATLAYPGVFTGIPNNGDVSLSSLSTSKFYAVGNPYPSTISADAFISANSSAGGTLYFWRKTNNLDQATSPTTSYAAYTLAGGVGTDPGSGSIIPNGTIQVGQGFIVNSGTATDLNFTNAMRTANNVGQILKTKNVVNKDRIWLNMTNTSGAFSQALVAYMDGATLGVDNAIDGLYFNDSPVALTSNINGGEYTIQGRPTFDVTDVVALNFKTDVAGDYSIGIDHVDGLFATGQDVYLVDSKTGIETNLKSGSYTFAAAAGTDNARFSLKYQKTLKVIASVFNDDSVTVYKNNGTLFVNSGASVIQNIKVYDIQGRLISEQKNVKANTASFSNLKASNQTLIVKVTSVDNVVVNKKVVN